jgi:diketogulonate reductase-like aldo/keto reductase
MGWDRDVRAVCRANGIVYQGFSLLTANARELRSETVTRIARRVSRTPAEVVFRFAIAVGMIPLTGTSRREHMQLDLGCVDFELDEGDIAAIESVSG